MRRECFAAIAAVCLICAPALAQTTPEVTTIEASDGLAVTADVYRAEGAGNGPWIVLAHQAGSSRGEYRTIAPRLNALGFSAVALDQRSGGAFGGVDNETAARARQTGRPTGYGDAIPDLKAGLAFARAQTSGPVLLWGSSYSAALALILAGEEASGNEGRIDGVIAMSPGEYIRGRSVARAAQGVSAPVLIASAPTERDEWSPIFAAIPHERKTGFAAQSGGMHGSSTLIAERTPNAEEYWRVVETFLATDFPAR